MKVPKAHIASYIPQRPPFIMIDNLIEASENEFVTDFLVMPDNLFLENGILREFALIENIAQSSAAGLAYVNQSSRSMPVEGFIGSISSLVMYELPVVHDKIDTVVSLLHQLDHMYLLKGENFLDGKKLMECKVKLVGRVPDLPGF